MTGVVMIDPGDGASDFGRGGFARIVLDCKVSDHFRCDIGFQDE